jgi:hypothetical protein
MPWMSIIGSLSRSRGLHMSTSEAIEYVLRTRLGVRSSDDYFEIYWRNDYLGCSVRGQQGGWVMSSIPLTAAWVAI